MENNQATATAEGNAGQNGGEQQAQTPAAATYTQEQLDGIVNGRVQRAEQAALKSFFEQQGLSGDEITKAINSYKETKQSQQPDVAAMQQQLTQAQAAAQKAAIENIATMEALALGIDAKTIPYALRLADLSGAWGDGTVNTGAVKAALNKAVEDVPALKPVQQQAQGFQQIGAAGGQNNNATDANLDKIFGINKK